MTRKISLLTSFTLIIVLAALGLIRSGLLKEVATDVAASTFESEPSARAAVFDPCNIPVRIEEVTFGRFNVDGSIPVKVRWQPDPMPQCFSVASYRIIVDMTFAGNIRREGAIIVAGTETSGIVRVRDLRTFGDLNRASINTRVIGTVHTNVSLGGSLQGLRHP